MTLIEIFQQSERPAKYSSEKAGIGGLTLSPATKQFKVIHLHRFVNPLHRGDFGKIDDLRCS